MEMNFDNLGLKISIPDQSIIFDKEEITKAIGFDEEQQNNTLFVISDKEGSGNVIILTYLADAESQEAYDELVDIYLEQNAQNGYKLEGSSEEDSSLKEYKFNSTEDGALVAIFTYINQHILICSSYCEDKNMNDVFEFSHNLMKTLENVENKD